MGSCKSVGGEGFCHGAGDVSSLQVAGDELISQ